MLTGDGETYTRGYKFDLTPTSDRRPFFHNFLRWRTLPEVLPLVRSGGMPLLESGYVLLLAALAQAIVLGLVLIVLPLAAGAPRRSLRKEPATSRRTIVYFLAIGLGFMFIELAAIHQFLLYLEEPIYASAIVLTAFLAFAGIGSYASARFAEVIGERHTSRLAALAVIVLCLGRGIVPRSVAHAQRRRAPVSQDLPVPVGDRAAGLRHGSDVPHRPHRSGQPGAGPGAVGLGGKRLCLGGGRGARDGARAGDRV